jgi:hypothetical protein
LRALELVLQLVVLRVRLRRAIKNIAVQLREVFLREIVALKFALQIDSLRIEY